MYASASAAAVNVYVTMVSGDVDPISAAVIKLRVKFRTLARKNNYPQALAESMRAKLLPQRQKYLNSRQVY